MVTWLRMHLIDDLLEHCHFQLSTRRNAAVSSDTTASSIPPHRLRTRAPHVSAAPARSKQSSDPVGIPSDSACGMRGRKGRQESCVRKRAAHRLACWLPRKVTQVALGQTHGFEIRCWKPRVKQCWFGTSRTLRSTKRCRQQRIVCQSSRSVTATNRCSRPEQHHEYSSTIGSVTVRRGRSF